MAIRKPVREKHDIIDKAIAFVVMTTQTIDRKKGVGVAINELVNSVPECLNGMKVTFDELRVRILSWTKRGWGAMMNNIFHPSKKGRQHLGRMARKLAT